MTCFRVLISYIFYTYIHIYIYILHTYISYIYTYFACISCIYIVYLYRANICSPCTREIGARAPIRGCALVCASDCPYLFGMARAMQDLRIRNTERLSAEACQMSH